MKKLVLIIFVVLFAPCRSDALEGMRCRRSPECTASEGEICVADSLTSSWGTCRRLKVLP